MERRKKIQTQGGQAVLTTVVFFLFISLAIIFGMITPVVTDARLARDVTELVQSYFLGEAGAEDAIVRLRNGYSVPASYTLSLGGETTTITVTDQGGSQKQIVSSGDVNDRVRNVEAFVDTSTTGAAFNYGVQVGEGGLEMKNTSTVEGNVYSNGSVNGSNSNLIKGDVVSAGSNGLIDGINATGTAYANIIQNSDVEGDAYYQSISNTDVLGTEFPGSADQPDIDLPIQDSQIEEWKAAAEAGGIINSPCPYEIQDDITIGPVKIECDLNISGDPTITIGGHIWVSGDIEIQNTAILQVSSSLGDTSVAIVADNESNHLSSSKINLKNSTQYLGSGDENSYILMVSQNESSEQGGNEIAIEVQNSASGDLLVYAGHGRIVLQNSVNLREVTGYTIELQNSTNIVYKAGLGSLLFNSGPGGSWVVSSWKEIE